MERIAKLLFATTVITIFMYLLVFTSVDQAGNGGEYWGFDGSLEPERAASSSFDQRDYRFLEVSFVNSDGIQLHHAPSSQRCDNHPFGVENSLRPSSRKPIHGLDSQLLATEFANRYNQSMARYLKDMMGGRCEQSVPDDVD